MRELESYDRRRLRMNLEELLFGRPSPYANGRPLEDALTVLGKMHCHMIGRPVTATQRDSWERRLKDYQQQGGPVILYFGEEIARVRLDVAHGMLGNTYIDIELLSDSGPVAKLYWKHFNRHKGQGRS